MWAVAVAIYSRVGAVLPIGNSRNGDSDAVVLLGDSFLVCPVLDPSGVRDVYLPKGSWVDFWNGETIDGPIHSNGEICIAGDPVFTDVIESDDELAVLTRWAVSSAPRLNTLPIHEHPWHDGGADDALSLGLVLATVVTALREMEQRGVALAAAAVFCALALKISTAACPLARGIKSFA